jgi:hypothetical protein
MDNNPMNIKLDKLIEKGKPVELRRNLVKSISPRQRFQAYMLGKKYREVLVK